MLMASTDEFETDFAKLSRTIPLRKSEICNRSRKGVDQDQCLQQLNLIAMTQTKNLKQLL